jgi:rubredoxin
MSLELDRVCPECGEEKTFYRAAAMKVHLGTKEKWSCPDCEYCFVRIANGETAVDTSA